mgnify:CR=1 FL=1
MKAHKVDGDQKAIVKALREAGCSVAITSMVGNGFPDLCVGRHHKNYGNHSYLLEVKRYRTGKLTPEQKEFHDTWRGHVAIVSSVDDALIAVGIV